MFCKRFGWLSRNAAQIIPHLHPLPLRKGEATLGMHRRKRAAEPMRIQCFGDPRLVSEKREMEQQASRGMVDWIGHTSIPHLLACGYRVERKGLH
ncbi:MAG: hypothetical protein AUI00_02360 [Verrucomicrobia bacterium 13_2_20CM_2_54_15]|nr:MAG: hypothetical protein AUI00_02360 [Verrucomicrobia bacterium 13_2_20CM_2_54_15]